MNAQQLLNELERRSLLPEKVLRKAVAKVDAAGKEVTAKSLAKSLVNAGHLTSHQANELLTALAERTEAEKKEQAQKDQAKQQQAPADSELGLAQIDDDDGRTVKAEAPSEPPTVFELDRPESEKPVEEVHELDEVDSAEEDHDQLWDEATETTTASPGRSRAPLKKLGKLFVGPDGKSIFKSKRWDSPLMLVGGGTLMILILVCVLLVIYLSRGNADQIFEAAEQSYRDQSYRQAMEGYANFAKRFSGNPRASFARVRQKLARLRQAVENSGDLESALEIANQELPLMQTEEAIDEGRAELVGILPQIYEGFVNQARSASESGEDIAELERLIELAGQAKTLVENSDYLPTSLREPIQPRIDDTDSELRLVEREIARDRERREVITKMREAIESGETAQAYQLRRDLLARYLGLAADDELQQTVLEIGAREASLVQPAELEIGPTVEDTSRPIAASVVLSDRIQTGNVNSLAGQVLYVLAGGAVLGVDASSGDILWRRFVGYDTAFHPVAVDESKPSDALVADQQRHEIMRLSARDGKPVWRVAIGERFTRPTISPTSMLLTTDSGKLLDLDKESGELKSAISLPQTPTVGPAADADRGRLYQPGEHSSLFVLSANEGKCEETVFIGHRAGSLDVAPTFLRSHLFVAENRGPDFCLVHVYRTDEQGLSLKPAIRPMRLDGLVRTPPLVFGNRVLLATSRGAIHVYEVDPGADRHSVREVAKRPGSPNTDTIPYPLVDRGQLWVADTKLTKYEFLAARGELAQKWIHNDADIFQGPLQRKRDVLVHLRRRQGSAGLVLAATAIARARNNSNDGAVLWETELSVPMADDLIWDQQQRRLIAVTANGALFDIDSTALRSGHIRSASERVTPGVKMSTFGASRGLSNGQLVMPAQTGARQLLVYRPGTVADRVKLLPIELPAPELSSVAALGNALLVPTQSGHVHLIDPATGEKLAEPFQPRLAAGERLNWLQPVVTDTEKGEFIVVERSGRTFRVARQSEPRTQLAQLASTELKIQVTMPPARLGETLFVCGGTDEQRVLLALKTTDLSVAKTLELHGFVNWGPRVAGDVILLSTDRGKLVCVSAHHEVQWSVDISELGNLAGDPLLVDTDFICCSTRGAVWRLQKSNGTMIPWKTGESESQQSWLELGEPILGSVQSLRGRLLLTGYDGTVHLLELPQGSSVPGDAS